MKQLVFSIIANKWPVAVRYLLSWLGIWLAAKGYFTAEQWTGLSAQAEQVIGSLVALGIMLAALKIRPSTKALVAAQKIDVAREAGSRVVVSTDAGIPVTTVPPKASAIPTTSRSR